MNREQQLLLQIEIQKLCLLIRLYIMKNRRNKRKNKNRRFAVRKLLLERRMQGYYSTLIPRMRLNDVESFKDFHRMDPTSFEELLGMLGRNLRDDPARFEEGISLGERLALTLRYLTSGDTMKSIGYFGFRIGVSTTSNIIREMCQLLWTKLQFVFPTPSEAMWNDISNAFYEQWGFPNCLGAIDGKHVVVQSTPSLLLMTIVDANCKFILVDIGAVEPNSDAGVFESSKFGRNILENPQEMHIPAAKALPDTNEIAQFVFVADEALPLRTNIMRPYPSRCATNMPQEEVIFNKRLSCARRVVENAFGILSSRFKIYRKPIIASKETANNIVKATVCLHNWLGCRPSAGYFTGDMVENESTEIGAEVSAFRTGLQSMRSMRSNHALEDAIETRNVFTTFFNCVPKNC